MTEDEQHNPFEDHIESEAFDISRLDVRKSAEGLDPDLKALLNNLPQPLDYHLWDEALDERQKYLCAHLATELVDRVIRANHGAEVAELSDDDLLMILTVPVALAMIVQEQLGNPTIAPVEPTPPDDVSLDDFRTSHIDASNNPAWAKRLGHAVNYVVDRFQMIMQYFRRRG